MPDVTLTERQQRALGALLGAAHGSRPATMCEGDILLAIAALIPCDGVGAASRERGERCEQRFLVGPATVEFDSSRPGPGSSAPSRRDDLTGGARHEICVDVRPSTDRSAQVWLDRAEAPFTPNEYAILAMISPAVQHLIAHRSPPEISTLTTQERRVLESVAAGRSNAEIADELFVAPSTVRKHLEHVFRKLGVGSRSAAVAVAEGRSSSGTHSSTGPDLLSTGNSPIRE